MAYCTYTDVQLECGTSVGTLTTANITSLIVRSDAEIDDILTENGFDIPTSATALTTASIYFTIAKIKRRQSHELSRPNSLSLGGDIAFSVNAEAEAQEYEAKAKTAINTYMGAASTGYLSDMIDGLVRDDKTMNGLSLDQSTPYDLDDEERDE